MDAAGALTPVPGSPFPGAGVNSNVPLLAPRDQILFLSNQLSDSVTVFNVAANGSLTLVSGSPFKVFGNGNPTQMATTRKGDFLCVVNRNKLVSALSVSSTGALTPVAGSPFLTGNAAAVSQPAGVYPPKRCGVD